MSRTSTVECAGCEYEIRPGDSRKPTSEGPMHGLCAVASDLQDRYRFYITNPAEQDAVSFALWHLDRDEGREFPVMNNTGGLNAIQSASLDVGDGIEPSIEFFKAIAYANHWLSCLMRGIDHEEIQSEIESTYEDGRVPDHEEWGIHLIVPQIHAPKPTIPELAPIRDFAACVTEFGVPPVKGRDEGAETVVPDWM